ncbi:hypothetical protein MASR2M50_25150 [Thauera sp.]
MSQISASRPIRTRFAPSPTGYLHIGGARTALFSWAFARRHGGSFILRIEDTDVARSTPAAVQAILDGMHWLGLEHDEGPFYQMQRMDRYKEVIGQMLAAGTAYHCYMSSEELDQHPRGAARARREAALRRALAPRGRQDPAAAARGRAAGGALLQPEQTAWWPGTTWSRAASRSPTPRWTTSSSRAPTARRPTTSAWWWTTGTWASPTSSAATTM